MSDLPITKIAVIGIGSAGLAQLKQAKDAFNRPQVASRTRLELVGFESRDDVGGLWNYDPSPKPFTRKLLPDDSEGAGRAYLYPVRGQNPTPFYDNLRATLPHDLMSFRGFTFPENTPEIPWGLEVLKYLQDYATEYDLRRYTRFNTRVERLYLTPNSDRPDKRRWTIHSSGPDGEKIEEFDFVSVNNGHYSDMWIPPTSGLSTFPGEILHSREYRRPTDYTGKTVLVVGSGNSGADIVRQIASLNIGQYDEFGARLHRDQDQTRSNSFTTVYQSSSGGPPRSGYNTGEEPWAKFIKSVPLIDHIDPPSSSSSPSSASHPSSASSSPPSSARIHFQDNKHPPLDTVDTIIFATGYYNSLPFCKASDEPWASRQVLEETITLEEREGGDDWETGGLKGLHMTGLDELLLFLENDRSMAFPGLPYQIVPFPFSEVQARLAALLWAGLLPNFPSHPNPPPNPFLENGYLTPPATPPITIVEADDLPAARDSLPTTKLSQHPARISERTRRELIFAVPYEWDYTQYAFEIMKEADGGDEIEGYWKQVEGWRKDRRRDTGLRKRLLGY
ncbi:hypothetical protein BCR39DRAFT_532347 [Naematelia encephala]|uniref:FAD/NAD(P)-binding domain-containing protein n=1 Tax=Naematelia encephala TaxID=71784 RepID=A0A1Y2B4C0_9TREE|nr:hypothetical protein BCR39DRAFT_532347 [Naematelia encephala]